MRPPWILVLLLVAAVFGASTLAGSAANTGGSWILSSRVPRDAGWVPAAQSGELTVYLRNNGDDVSASVDPTAASGSSLESIAAGNALIAWTSPLDDGGTSLVGIARSDVVAVTVMQNDGNAATLALDSLNGFSYTAAAPISEIEALDPSGIVVGAIAVPPTGSACGTSICRELTTSTPSSASAPAGSTPLWGIYSTPLSEARTLVKRPPTKTVVPKNGQTTTVTTKAAASKPLVRVTTYGGKGTLSRVSAKTLRPLGRRLLLPTGFAARAISPDGKQLLGLVYPSTLSIVDLNTLTLAETVDRRLAADVGSANVRTASWPSGNRILIVTQTYSGQYDRHIGSRKLIAVDPRTGNVVWRRTLTSKLTLLSAQRAGDRLVLFLAASGARPKKQTVIVASIDGSLHSTTIPTPYPKDSDNAGALVVTNGPTPAAYLVADRTILSIDLDNAELTPHHVSPPPESPRTSPSIWGQYEALGLGQKLVVNGQVFPLPPTHGIARSGLYLINPKTWKTTLINRSASEFAVSGNRLITYTRTPFEEILGAKPVPRSNHGSGIAIYNQNGTRLNHLYGQRSFLSVDGTPNLSYAIAVRPVLLVNVPSGRRGLAPSLFGQRLLFSPTTGKSLGLTTTLGSSPTLIYQDERFGG